MSGEGSSGPLARVVLLALDGVGPDALSAALTPVLASLPSAPGGGWAGQPSTTYPGFASLLTGCGMERHGVRSTADREGAVPGWAGDIQVRVPTLLEAVAAAGVPARAVCGDHLLQSVLRIGPPDAAWPVGRVVGPHVAVDAHGYPVNAEVRPHLLAAVRALVGAEGPAFVFGHLNEADTVGHDEGPVSAGRRGVLAATDAIVGEVLDELAPAWDSTVVIVISDHGMEARDAHAWPLVPDLSPGFGLVAGDWLGDGGAAWVRLRAGVGRDLVEAWAASLEGVAAWSLVESGLLRLDAAPGRAFAPPEIAALMRAGGVDRSVDPAGLLLLPSGRPRWLGIHGSSRTVRTLASVTGGHPAALAFAAALGASAGSPGAGPVHLWDWAPTIARLLGVALPDATGCDILA